MPSYPLPLTWQLYNTTACPGCDKPMHSGAKLSDFKVVKYCVTVGCPNQGYRYMVELTLDSCSIVEVLNAEIG